MPPSIAGSALATLPTLQAYANELANAQDDAELAKHVSGLLSAEGIRAPGAGLVMIAHDTRPSGPSLAEAAAAGARCLGVEAEMCGLLTTPQLHWMVMCRNKGQPWGEADYYAALAGAYKQLVAGTQPLGQVRGCSRSCCGMSAGSCLQDSVCPRFGPSCPLILPPSQASCQPHPAAYPPAALAPPCFSSPCRRFTWTAPTAWVPPR